MIDLTLRDLHCGHRSLILVRPHSTLRRAEWQDLQAFGLEGQVAVVTGGNGGIGRAIALGLAGAGAKVAIWGRNSEKNAEALAALRAVGPPAVALAGRRGGPEPAATSAGRRREGPRAGVHSRQQRGGRGLRRGLRPFAGGLGSRHRDRLDGVLPPCQVRRAIDDQAAGWARSSTSQAPTRSLAPHSRRPTARPKERSCN